MYEAASCGARLIVLPEGTIPAYVIGHEALDEEANRQALADCKVVASETRTTITIGMARKVRSCLVNTATIVDADGSVAGWAEKHFLWHFDAQWFAPGTALEPVRTSAGTIGALVCADGRIPTIAHTLVARGAEILVMPTAWVTSGRDPASLENVQADLLARVRAEENGVPFIASNKCGVELESVAYCGKSQIVDARGNVLALASEREPDIVYADVELGGNAPIAEPVLLEPATGAPLGASRIALAAEDLSDDALRRAIRLLEADVAIGPRGILSSRGEPVAIARGGDRTFLHPGGLVPYRRNGGLIALWDAGDEPRDRVRFARARALELRMYVVVIDRATPRAYAVDPDGSVACGTFDDYRIASFAFDPHKACQTTVAPNTDILEGLARAAESARS